MRANPPTDVALPGRAFFLGAGASRSDGFPLTRDIVYGLAHVMSSRAEHYERAGDSGLRAVEPLASRRFVVNGSTLSAVAGWRAAVINWWARPNTVHFMIWMAVAKSVRVIGCGARGRSG